VEVSTCNDDAGTDNETSLGKRELDLPCFALALFAGVDRKQIIAFRLAIDNPPAIDRYVGEQKAPGRTPAFGGIDDITLKKIDEA